MSLSVRDVSKEFTIRGKPSFNALSNLSLEFEKGRFHTLLGPSGCGKTTLLRIIAGFEGPTRGQVFHNGKDITDLAPNHRGFPMVFQSYALFPHMTVAANVGYGLGLRNIGAEEIRRRVSKILELLDLSQQKDKYPHQMSGGQQQRVALARALVLEPEIILFDEPLSNLDARLRLSMREEIRSLQRRLEITAIYVTHDQEEAMAISDRLVILNQGRIEQSGAPVDVYRRPVSQFVARFLGCTNVFPVNEVRRLLGDSHRGPESGMVVMRPDSFELSKSGGRHRAVVENAMFLGTRFVYTLDYEGTRFSIDAPWIAEGDAFAIGDKVTFDLKPDRLHFV